MISATPRRRYKLRLINPNSPLSTITLPDVIQRITMGRKALFAPTGLMICAAVAPEHWDVEIIDECVLDHPHTPRADCDVVGLSAMTTQAKRAYQLADAYRALGVTVILGGIHPSALPEEALLHGDVVCKGDAEATLPHVLADWEKQRGTPSDGLSGMPTASFGLKKIYDWAEYPAAPIATPRKDLLNPADYLVANPIQTTRGCPHTCTFCTTPGVFGRKYRLRSIPDIITEIRQAQERHKSWCFIFADDNFGGNHQWAMELCSALEPLKISWASQCDILISRNDSLLAAMKRSGCLGLILGLESRKPDTLAEAGKRYVQAESYEWRIRKIQSYGISLWGAFIFGFDHDSWQDLMFTTRWAQRMGLAMSCYPILTPYPGTGMWDHFVKSGRITTRDWDQYNGASIVFEPARMTTGQLRHAQMAAFAEFYSLRSAFRRLKLWPFKKFSWMTHLAIIKGIHYYYAKHGRAIPSFRDFIDPDSRAWRYLNGRRPKANGENGAEITHLAAKLATEANPYRQIAHNLTMTRDVATSGPITG